MCVFLLEILLEDGCNYITFPVRISVTASEPKKMTSPVIIQREKVRLSPASPVIEHMLQNLLLRVGVQCTFDFRQQKRHFCLPPFFKQMLQFLGHQFCKNKPLAIFPLESPTFLQRRLTVQYLYNLYVQVVSFSLSSSHLSFFSHMTDGPTFSLSLFIQPHVCSILVVVVQWNFDL